MQSKSCLSTIKSEYSSLTKKEKQLADYILKNYENVVTMTTAELAANSEVVKSVVIRFCRDIGFEGYTEFKLMLSRELARNEQFSFSPYISGGDTAEDIFKKIFSSNIKTLHDTLSAFDTDKFKKAVELLDNAQYIYVYGIGTSAAIASDFQYRLTEIGKNAFFISDVVRIRVSTQNIKNGDIAIGISNSGQTCATVDALKHAKENGAQTICVTSYPKSEIVKHSTVALTIKTDEIQYPIEAISSRIAHISLLDSLAVSISAKRYDKAVERAAKTHDLVEQIRY